MLFTQSFIANSRVCAEQFDEVAAARTMTNRSNRALAANAGLVVNEGIIPQDVYQEFDNVTVETMRLDQGDVFLNDLLPLSKSVSIGKLIHKFRQASDAGTAQTSMTGQIGIKMDQVEYTFDGSLVPIHDAGFYRNFREWNAQRSEGFDALIDDQRETIVTIRDTIADRFLDGQVDADGNIIVLDGIQWAGMRADTRVAQINIGAAGINFDFTDTTKTFVEIEAAFKQIRDTMWLTNKCSKDITYYVSDEIASNMERASSESFDSQKILQRLAGLQKVAAIKGTSKLSGNELMGFPLDNASIKPIVGMGVNTVAMPRPVYNSNYEFATWAAIGFEVREDYFGNTCAFFAQDLG